jgi:CRISPR-associated protein Cmr6
MRRPLYQGRDRVTEVAEKQPDGNASLWFDKFFDQWDDNFTLSAGAKQRFITRFISDTITVGTASLLEESHQRRASLVQSRAGAVQALETATRLVIGTGNPNPLENGLQWRRDYGVPYIPGSSIKGVARDWAVLEEGGETAIVSEIFGHRDEGSGSVAFLDALPLRPVELHAEVMTPHHGRGPEDWHEPNPIPFIAVAPGQTFLFAVVACGSSGNAASTKTALQWLQSAVIERGIGAKTATGYGRFRIPLNRPIKATIATAKYSAGQRISATRQADPKSKGRFYAVADDGVGGFVNGGDLTVKIGDALYVKITAVLENGKSYNFVPTK